MEQKPRVVFCGDSQVGKTTLIYKYQKFQSAASPTIVCDQSELHLTTSDGRAICAAVWDVAGNIEMATLMPLYCRNANVCVLVAAVDDDASIAHVAGWREKVQSIVGDGVSFIIAANTTDLRVPGAPGFAAPEHDCVVCETSALTGYGVDQLFTAVADACSTAPIRPIRGAIRIERAPQRGCLPSCQR
jgi:small GTP-binding protein